MGSPIYKILNATRIGAHLYLQNGTGDGSLSKNVLRHHAYSWTRGCTTKKSANARIAFFDTRVICDVCWCHTPLTMIVRVVGFSFLGVFWDFFGAFVGSFALFGFFWKTFRIFFEVCERVVLKRYALLNIRVLLLFLSLYVAMNWRSRRRSTLYYPWVMLDRSLLCVMRWAIHPDVVTIMEHPRVRHVVFTTTS